MLEYNNSVRWKEFEPGYIYYFFEGILASQIKIVQRIYKYQKDEKTRKRVLDVLIAGAERREELNCFISKYPNADAMQLAGHILNESEYWYLYIINKRISSEDEKPEVKEGNLENKDGVKSN